MTAVKLRDVFVGEGIPKICVPITSATAKGIIKEAELARSANVDIVEWRADFFQHLQDSALLNDILVQLRQTVGNIPIIFTIRTKKEGGNADISAAKYEEILINAANSALIDTIDIELFTEELVLKRVIAFCKGMTCKIIVSNHDFDTTPPKVEIANRLAQMETLGADIAKIAVSPNSSAHVLTLLDVTNEFSSQSAIPVVTMSMGKLGSVSRVCGEIFGSSITFATIGQSSAPGQMNVDDVRYILDALHMETD